MNKKIIIDTKTITGQPASFQAVNKLADVTVEERFGPAMLVAWKNLVTGEFSPNVEACNSCGLEGWELYAQSRGADIRLETGDGGMVLLYKGLE